MEVRPRPGTTTDAESGAVVRIIKKYPNRRLYDTERSRYITLTEVQALVLEGTAFEVIDQRSQADLTDAILLQVIADQEARGAPLLTRSLLTQLIRAYRGPLRGAVARHLERALAALAPLPRDRDGER